MTLVDPVSPKSHNKEIEEALDKKLVSAWLKDCFFVWWHHIQMTLFSLRTFISEVDIRRALEIDRYDSCSSKGLF